MAPKADKLTGDYRSNDVMGQYLRDAGGDVPTMAKNMSGDAYGTPFQAGAMKQSLENDPFERMKYEGAVGAMDPLSYQDAQRQRYMDDPRINQLYDQQQGALGSMTQAGQQFGDAAGQYSRGRLVGGAFQDMMRQQAYGQGPSLADKYGAAQRQQAQGDIAKQAVMSSRGGTDLASRRAAIMGASNVGANMAAQISAQRVAERQQAQQNYLAMRGQMRQDQASGVQALGQSAGMNVNIANAYNQPMTQVQGGFGYGAQAGQTDYSQQHTALPNYFAEPGAGQ